MAVPSSGGVGVVLFFIIWQSHELPLPREAIPELDRRLAPVLALGIIGSLGLVAGCFWVAYQMIGKT
jgi:hypothetical protein